MQVHPDISCETLADLRRLGRRIGLSPDQVAAELLDLSCEALETASKLETAVLAGFQVARAVHL